MEANNEALTLIAKAKDLLSAEKSNDEVFNLLEAAIDKLTNVQRGTMGAI